MKKVILEKEVPITYWDFHQVTGSIFIIVYQITRKTWFGKVKVEYDYDIIAPICTGCRDGHYSSRDKIDSAISLYRTKVLAYIEKLKNGTYKVVDENGEKITL